MRHVLISHHALQHPVLRRVFLRLFYGESKIGILHLSRRIAKGFQLSKHIAKEYGVVVERVEKAALSWCLCKSHYGISHLVDRRELHRGFRLFVGVAAQHLIKTHPTHSRVGLEVYLEFSVSRARSEVAHTHNLAVEGAAGNSLKHFPLAYELRMHIAVLYKLSVVQFALCKHTVVSWHSVNRQSCRTVGGNMYEPCSRLLAEVYAVLCPTYIHVLYLCTTRVVFHHSSTVENGIEPPSCSSLQGERYWGCYVTHYNMET